MTRLGDREHIHSWKGTGRQGQVGTGAGRDTDARALVESNPYGAREAVCHVLLCFLL